MANQHTTNALSGIQAKNRLYQPAEILLLWETRKKIAVNEHGCWIWQGAKQGDGYGNIWANERCWLVHRYIYTLCIGEVESGKEVCHNCPGGDNPACCNPKHLFVGTHLENMQDAAKKGRIKPRDSKGEKNPCAKLTEEKVRQIRVRFTELKGVNRRDLILAAEFSVSAPTIYRVVKRKIWGHVA